MNRMTRWDPVCHCYKAVREQEMGRSVIQELGVYESIHEKEIENAVNIGDIRDMYFTGAAQLDPYWENFGKEKAAPDNWIPVTKKLPPEEEMVLVSCRTAKGVNTVNRAYYMNGSWHGSGSMSGVKAWQPMPDAYEGE